MGVFFFLLSVALSIYGAAHVLRMYRAIQSQERCACRPSYGCTLHNPCDHYPQHLSADDCATHESYDRDFGSLCDTEPFEESE